MEVKLKCRDDRTLTVTAVEKDGGLVLRAGKGGFSHDFVKIWVDEKGVARVVIVDIDVGAVTYSPKEGHDIACLGWAR